MKPNHRASWSPNGEEGWTVGPSLQHYRCINCYFPKTRSQRDCDTVTFFPTVIPYPKINLDDYLRQATDDIISILTNPPHHTTPTLKLGDKTKNALLKIAKIFHRDEPIPLIPENNPPPRVDITSPPRVKNNSTKEKNNKQT